MGCFFARQEDIDKPRVFWYSIKRPLGPCWCGAMAAQLICNQWVAGSTPVTSSKKNPAICRYNGGVYRGIFAFICAANLSECALFVPYCSKNALSCSLQSALCRMPGGVSGAVQAARFAGSLGVAAARAGWCPPGAFPPQGRV